jgi:hypothetical protein
LPGQLGIGDFAVILDYIQYSNVNFVYHKQKISFFRIIFKSGLPVKAFPSLILAQRLLARTLRSYTVRNRHLGYPGFMVHAGWQVQLPRQPPGQTAVLCRLERNIAQLPTG